MDLAERFLKRIFRDVLAEVPGGHEFFNERIDKTVIDTLQHVVDSQFIRVCLHRGGRDPGKSGRRSSFPSPGATTCRPSTSAT